MSEFKWTPRVPKEKIYRLYQQDITGLYDEKLLDDVGITLYLRCKDILAVKSAREGRVRCPDCYKELKENYIRRPQIRKKETADQPLQCTVCGCSFLWKDYQKSFKRNQLNAGGAVPAFEAYVREYPRAKQTQEKFGLIDRLIHEFHYSNKQLPDLPTRSVGPNLLNGRLEDIVVFLDELSNGVASHKTETNKKWYERSRQWSAAWYEGREELNPLDKN